MRAALLEGVGKLGVVDDVDIAEPGPGQVRVAVKNCGICHSDLSVVKGSFPSPTPIVLGHEAAGIVERVGEGVTHLAEGDHVVLTPCPPCGQCYWCVRSQAALCVNSNNVLTNTFADGSTGLARKGEIVYRGLGVAGFAEKVLTQATGAVMIPPDVPLEVACVIGCAVQTGVGAALNTAGVEPGSTVLVMGAGGIGLSITQGARIAGASRIVVSDPVEERRAAAVRFGATDTIDPRAEDAAECSRELTGGIGVDYAFDAVGSAALLEQGISATRNGGTTVIVGAVPVDQPLTISPITVFGVQEKKLVGCILGSCNSLYDIPRMVGLWQSGRLDLEGLITSRRPLAEINEAMEDLTASRGIRTVLEI